MNCACAVLQEPGSRRVCGLLGDEKLAGSCAEGRTVALKEVVEHFRIEWELTPYQDLTSAESSAAGFVLDLTGTHEQANHDPGRSCVHCSNLMLGLRVVGDWIFPSGAKCLFCEVQRCSTFVRGDCLGQREAISTRTFRLASHGGTPCQIGACHVWCMEKTKERLSVIGAVERKKRQAPTGRNDHE